jgi:hypothetical protein
MSGFWGLLLDEWTDTRANKFWVNDFLVRRLGWKSFGWMPKMWLKDVAPKAWRERCGEKREEHSAIWFGCIRFQVLSIPPRGLCWAIFRLFLYYKVITRLHFHTYFCIPSSVLFKVYQGTCKEPCKPIRWHICFWSCPAVWRQFGCLSGLCILPAYS